MVSMRSASRVAARGSSSAMCSMIRRTSWRALFRQTSVIIGARCGFDPGAKFGHHLVVRDRRAGFVDRGLNLGAKPSVMGKRLFGRRERGFNPWMSTHDFRLSWSPDARKTRWNCHFGGASTTGIGIALSTDGNGDRRPKSSP